MARELLSTPPRLRLAGFLVVVAGSVLAGICATRRWATVGFPRDAHGTLDVPTHGTDIWEGKVVLLLAGVGLVLLIVMRLARSRLLRRSLGVALIVLGLVCAALPLFIAVRPETRLGGEEGLERWVSSIAAELELPEDVVREQVADQARQNLRVELEPALWLTVAGGLLMAVGGALSLAWARTREVSTPPD